MNESEWMRRIDARLAEGNDLMRENRKALNENRQFTHELLLRFDKALERSDRRWRTTLDEFLRDRDRTMEKLLDRYFGPSGNGSDAGQEPGPA